jgi:DNA polymerase zeta
MTARSSPPFTPPKSSPEGVIKDEPTSPLRNVTPLSESEPARLGEDPDDIQTGSSSDSDYDLDNPFEAFAMTQFSQTIKAEVDSRAVQQEVTTPFDNDDIDEEELHRAIHEKDLKHHAEEGAKFRATQAAPQRNDESDEYDDEDIDEIFRRTVFGGMGTPGSYTGTRTPTRRGTMTPTTGSRSGGLDSRRVAREQRMREQAGFVDLRLALEFEHSLAKLINVSSIMDRSSVSLSPSPRFDPRLRTPQKPRTPVSEKATPTSLVRNMFARNRGAVSPIVTPSKRPILPSTNTVVLPEAKRSLSFVSPPPEDFDIPDREPSPTPTRPRTKARRLDVKPKIEDRGVRFTTADAAFPPLQQTIVSKVSNESADSNGQDTEDHPGPQPTLLNEEIPGLEPTFVDKPTKPAESRKRKRVRLESPDAIPKQATTTPPISSVETLSSAHSAPTDQTSGSSTLVATNRSKTAWTYTKRPPDPREIAATTDPPQVYQEPYFSNHSDVPGRAKMFAGRMFSLKGNGVGDLSEFENTVGSGVDLGGNWLKGKKVEGIKAKYGWEFGVPPPGRKVVVDWCAKVDAEEADRGMLYDASCSRP